MAFPSFMLICQRLQTLPGFMELIDIYQFHNLTIDINTEGLNPNNKLSLILLEKTAHMELAIYIGY